MLLVADDANAAYSNQRILPKRADSPAVYPLSLPHRRRPDAVIIAPAAAAAARPFSSRAAPLNTPIVQTAFAELLWTLPSLTWDTGVKTLPARPRTGDSSRPGSRRPAPGKATRVR